MSDAVPFSIPSPNRPVGDQGRNRNHGHDLDHDLGHDLGHDHDLDPDLDRVTVAVAAAEAAGKPVPVVFSVTMASILVAVQFGVPPRR